MKITLLTYGSRGDVQPFLALAVGLKKAGYAATLAAPHRFADFIKQHGVDCTPLPGDPDELSRMFNDAGGNAYRMVRSMQAHVFRIAPDVIRAVHQAVQGAELLVHSFVFTTGAYSIAREMQIPDVSIQTFPVFAPTNAFPAIGMPGSLPGWMNRFSHWFSTQVFWHGGNAGYYQLRRRAPSDFPAQVDWPFTPVPDRPLTPLVFAISPQVIPFPTDWNPDHVHMPGYFFLESPDYQPSDELLRFLENGSPPVCITFGSMINRNMERITSVAIEGSQRTGSRVIVLTGWGGWTPKSTPDGVLFLKSAPHDWLFPRCKAVIHHGGAGTTAAGLRAGVPSILVPHAADQPFWGERVAPLGVGPRPIPIHHLTVDRIASALLEADSESVRQRAADLGRRIRAENGVEGAVSVIESCASRFGARN